MLPAGRPLLLDAVVAVEELVEEGCTAGIGILGCSHCGPWHPIGHTILIPEADVIPDRLLGHPVQYGSRHESAPGDFMRPYGRLPSPAAPGNAECGGIPADLTAFKALV